MKGCENCREQFPRFVINTIENWGLEGCPACRPDRFSYTGGEQDSSTPSPNAEVTTR